MELGVVSVPPEIGARLGGFKFPKPPTQSMPQAKLELTLPEGVWVGEVSRTYPDAHFRVLSAIPHEHTGVALVEVNSPELDAVLATMEDRPEFQTFEILNQGAESALVQFETTNPMLLMLIQSSGVPLELPFEFSDGTAVWEITASHESLSELGDQLDSFGIPFNVEALQYEVGEEALLTEAQQSLLETAVEMGYYESPRACSLTDIAEAVGRAKSTVSETLHRAEGQIITRYIEDEPGQRTSEEHS